MNATWYGTQNEANELLTALGRNCTCQFDSHIGKLIQPCPGHIAIVKDQRFMDGVLFARRIVEKLKAEEWDIASGPRYEVQSSKN